VKIIAKNVIF